MTFVKIEIRKLARRFSVSEHITMALGEADGILGVGDEEEHREIALLGRFMGMPSDYWGASDYGLRRR